MNFAQPFQDYEILDRLGAGAMGTVFKARHKKLGRIVALKVLKPSLARDERYVDRLRREARIVASLNHPNVVAGYDLGEEGGYHFFVMELAEGKSLRSLLAEWGMFPEQQVLSVATQVTAALDHAFQRGVIHRDVKPGNILIDDKGNVKLTDMGLAKGPTDLTLTKDGATVGTPQYISPEQARNPQAVDIRSDLYSLGATLYHMATGQPPFRAETLAELITKVLSEPVRSPQELNPELSTGLSLVIRKLLAKDLQVRYQTPRELLDDLERVGRNEAPGVDPGRLDQGERPPARRPLLRVSVGVGLLLAVLAGVWVGSRVRADGAPETPADVVFQQRLDQELRELRTPGERWQRLQAAADKTPPGQAAFLREREAQALFAIQVAVDNTVQKFMVEGRAEVEAWLCDGSRWPAATAFTQDWLDPRLRAAVGLPREALPTAVNRASIEELQNRAADVIALRDAGLLRDLDGYVAVAGPLARDVQELLRRQDFAGAQVRWDEGLQTFADGRAPGLLDHLSGNLLQELRAHFTAAHAAGKQLVERSEQDAASALQGDVEDGLRQLEQAQKDGGSRKMLAEGLLALRARIAQLHPPPGHFRLGGNPWPRIEQLLQTFEQRLELMQGETDQVRLEWYLDMAYRSLCAGAFREAATLLRAVDTEDPGAERDLQRHRDAVEATREVVSGILAGIERSTDVQGFPRAAAQQAVPLRVVRDGDQLRLRAELPGALSRDAALTEFLLPDLIARAERAGGLNGIPAERRDRGKLVLAMLAADDLLGMEAQLRSAGDGFLLESVWQRVRRIRGEQSDSARPGRGEVWTGVMQAWNTARRDRALPRLEEALLGFHRRFKDTDLEQGERLELKTVEAWLRGERARQQVEAHLRADAPAGAAITVQADDAALEATVRFGFAALRLLAGGDWNPVEPPGAMVHAAAASSEDAARKRMEVGSGMGPGTVACTCMATLWLPPADVPGDRVWLFEFRGVGVLLAMAQDGSVGASLLDGDAAHADAVQRGVKRALSGFLGSAARPHAVPGALHRLTIDVPGGRGKVRVRVLLEDTELLAEQREVDGRAAVSLRVLPTQTLGVAAVEFRGRGL